MLNNLSKAVESIAAKYPQWDEIVTRFFDDDDEDVIEGNEELLDAFSEILKDIIVAVKENDLNTQDIESIFKKYSSWGFVKKYLDAKLRVFRDYQPLRKLAKEDRYKAQYCIDLIWASYILRFNSHMEFDSNVPMEEEDFKKAAVRLDRFTDRCVSKIYHRDTIIIELKEESYLPQDLCEYIADKIDTNFEKIKLNYIIYRFSVFEKTLEDLTKKTEG